MHRNYVHSKMLRIVERKSGCLFFLFVTIWVDPNMSLPRTLDCELVPSDLLPHGYVGIFTVRPLSHCRPRQQGGSRGLRLRCASAQLPKEYAFSGVLAPAGPSGVPRPPLCTIGRRDMIRLARRAGLKPAISKRQPPKRSLRVLRPSSEHWKNTYCYCRFSA
ncbi:hypothetical protein T440DRAFT_5724 [Plenodomus tracheiphilus IPT5]|uniref:Uncharacterized protein n=1 Tax=Plenodomus tracheiphilus IPT5 TaxID=1408161 RepID=A0A6A7BP45_9PLEO|nr:hypothetical protein T440DRAFT_5724 [Plenodomus tracheiphilus IPT5]